MNDLATIEHILQSWPLHDSVVTWCPTHEKGNVVQLTTTTGTQYILKELVGNPSSDRLWAEYSVLQHLHTTGLPVAVPLLTYHQQPFAQISQHVYTLAPTLHPTVTTAETNDRQLYTNIGRALGKLHRALGSYEQDFPSWTMNLPHTLQTEIVPWLAEHLPTQYEVAVNSVLSTIAEPLYQALADLPTQRIHGDCHGGNILWDAGDVFGIIDLDHLPIGPRTYDLGHLLADMVKNRITDSAQLVVWLDTFPWIVRGYEHEMLLTRREKIALWYSMIASQFLFIYWFVKHERDDLTAKNVDVLMWVYGHKDRINAQVEATNESTDA